MAAAPGIPPRTPPPACEIRVFSKAAGQITPEVLGWVQSNLADQCGGEVVGSWARAESIPRADYIIVALRPTVGLRSGGSAHAVCGFGILKDTSPVDNPKLEMYLDVLCSSQRYGGRILASAEELARSMGKARMRLSSLEKPLGFYVKNQYKEVDDPCNPMSRVYRTGNRIDGFRMTKCITLQAELGRMAAAAEEDRRATAAALEQARRAGAAALEQARRAGAAPLFRAQTLKRGRENVPPPEQFFGFKRRRQLKLPALKRMP